MKNIDKKFIEEKLKAENSEDFISKLLFNLVHLQDSNNQGLNGLDERQNTRNSEIVKYLDAGLQNDQVKADLLAEIKESIDGKEIDISEVTAVLSQILSSNSALGDALDKISEQHPEIVSRLADIAKILRQNKPENGEIVASQEQAAKSVGKLLIELIKEVRGKKFPKEIEISGPVEIKEPKWWKPFEFSLDPLKEMFEKIKAHTFSVKIENQEKIDPGIFKNLPDDLAKKLSKVLAENLPKIRVSGGGMGNPFSFDEEGNLKITGDTGGGTEGGALETTLQDVLAQIQAVNGNTDGMEALLTTIRDYVDTLTKPSDIQLGELIPVMRNILQAIANPSYVDKSANQMRAQVTGSISTVTTVTGLTNIDGYQGKMLLINQNNSAWASIVRSRIS